MSGKKDAFGDEIVENKGEDFESLFLNSTAQMRTGKLRVGDKFEGEILSIGKEEAFVATGTPLDGMIATRDLQDENKQLKYKVGDRIAVVVVRATHDEVRLTRRDSHASSGDVDSLEDAFDMELPVEGRVIEVVKGGFRVKVLNQTAFCPVSQIDLNFVSDLTPYIDKKFDFLITQMDNGGRNLIVSRKKLLEMARAEQEGAFIQSVKVGDVIEGKVTRLEQFGAFVEVAPKVEWLVHISELAWGRIKHPREIVQEGTPVRVKVLKINEEGDRLMISLSLKQGGGELDPWFHVPTKFPVGSVVEGVVEKVQPYGLFVEIASGITGLLPKSKWRDSVDAAKFEGKKKGDRLKVQVDQIMLEERKLSLGLPAEGQDDSWREHAGARKGLGTFGDLFAQAQKSKK